MKRRKDDELEELAIRIYGSAADMDVHDFDDTIPDDVIGLMADIEILDHFGGDFLLTAIDSILGTETESPKEDIVGRELTDGVAMVWKYFMDHGKPEELRVALSCLQPALELVTKRTHHKASIDGTTIFFGPGTYSEKKDPTS